jgi:hypothetical protein
MHMLLNHAPDDDEKSPPAAQPMQPTADKQQLPEMQLCQALFPGKRSCLKQSELDLLLLLLLCFTLLLCHVQPPLFTTST